MSLDTTTYLLLNKSAVFQKFLDVRVFYFIDYRL